jgi:hypothetical protein
MPSSFHPRAITNPSPSAFILAIDFSRISDNAGGCAGYATKQLTGSAI